MSPFLKYTLARLGLFGLAALVMLSIPLDVSVLLKLMIAVIVSAVAAFFLLRGLREEASVQAVGMAQKRADNKKRLRAALNGDDDGGESATKSD
ncbi:DUF4229 domain-containing protein [Dactylosporangium sp. CA-139114]|uniref:DUF4229 domain-containing protein n=1 Tax=Dactylosporangium sp. CA-139114 TaxID=3239931 RepID=UPI003D999177